ncbi:helix-turn-helix transcriptional regulator [Microbulbifer sp. CnH-101-E]|uniref:helix-turn-helix transcriptional regulator n=1 Tax=unclassified Microbulbifer TaxID=2619833 RepID=UPI0040392432
MNLHGQSDKQILATLGDRLREYRLRMNLTQDDMAERAGLSTSTIKGLEAGRGRLDSLVAALRVLRRLDALEAFLPAPTVSPMQLALHGKQRKRARASNAEKALKETSAESPPKTRTSKNKKRGKPEW